jgi:hypothetical protein
MVGHIERVRDGAVLRLGGALGEPYDWACYLRFVSPGEVELMGVVKELTRAKVRDLARVLADEGIEWVRFERKRKRGRPHHRLSVASLLRS